MSDREIGKGYVERYSRDIMEGITLEVKLFDSALIMGGEDVFQMDTSSPHVVLLCAYYDKFQYPLRVEAADILTENFQNLWTNIYGDTLPEKRREMLVNIYCIINEAYLSYTEKLIMQSKPNGDN